MFGCIEFGHMMLCRNQILASDGQRAVCLAFDGLCDAVVMLNDNMTLALPSPRFAALVLRHDAVQSLCGRVFTDFLIPGDVERFKLFMSQPPDTIRATSSHRLQVQFATNTSGPVKCEVHHVHISRLPSIGTGSYHALGICELGDTGNEVLSSTVSSELRMTPVQPPVARRAHSRNTEYSDQYLRVLETVGTLRQVVLAHSSHSHVAESAC